jgi:hypothetical protein
LSPKGSSKLGPIKGIKGKRVTKNDGITKDKYAIKGQSQAPLHH